MGLPGIQELLVLAVLVGVVSYAFRGRGALGPTLVLRKFSVPPHGSGPIEISGRAAGFIAWLLTTLGVDTESTLVISDREVVFRGTSLAGMTFHLVPLHEVSSTHCAYRQPIWLLVLGGGVVVVGLFAAAFQNGGAGALAAGIIGGGICVVIYVLQKDLSIAVESRGGAVMGLAFKRSVIEDVAVNMQEGVKAIEAINQRVMALKASRAPHEAGG